MEPKEEELTFMATCMAVFSPFIPRTWPSYTSPNAPWPNALQTHTKPDKGDKELHSRASLQSFTPELHSIM